MTTNTPKTRDMGLIYVLEALVSEGYEIERLRVKKEKHSFNAVLGHSCFWSVEAVLEGEGGFGWRISDAQLRDTQSELLEVSLANNEFRELIRRLIVDSAGGDQPAPPTDQKSPETLSQAFAYAYATLIATTPERVSKHLKDYGAQRFGANVRDYFLANEGKYFGDEFIWYIFESIRSLVMVPGSGVTQVALIQMAADKYDEIQKAYLGKVAALAVAGAQAANAPANTAAALDASAQVPVGAIVSNKLEEGTVVLAGARHYSAVLTNLRFNKDWSMQERHDAAVRCVRATSAFFSRSDVQLSTLMERLKTEDKYGYLAGNMQQYFEEGMATVSSPYVAKVLQLLLACFQGDFDQDALLKRLLVASGDEAALAEEKLDRRFDAKEAAAIYARSEQMESKEPGTVVYDRRQAVPAPKVPETEAAPDLNVQPAAETAEPAEAADAQHSLASRLTESYIFVSKSEERDAKFTYVGKLHNLGVFSPNASRDARDLRWGEAVTYMGRILKNAAGHPQFEFLKLLGADAFDHIRAYMYQFFMNDETVYIDNRFEARAMQLLISGYFGEFSEGYLMGQLRDVVEDAGRYAKTPAEHVLTAALATGHHTDRDLDMLARATNNEIRLAHTAADPEAGGEVHLTGVGVGDNVSVPQAPVNKGAQNVRDQDLSVSLLVEEAYEDNYSAKLWFTDTVRFNEQDVDAKYRPTMELIFSAAPEEAKALISALDYRLSGVLYLKALATRGRSPAITFPLGALFLQMMASYLQGDIEATQILPLFLERRDAIVAQYGERMY